MSFEPYRDLMKKMSKEDTTKQDQKRFIDALRHRERRLNMNPEQLVVLRQKEAQRSRERRARLSEQQRAMERQKDAINKRHRRQMESEAEKALRRSLAAQRARERRATLPKEQSIKNQQPHNMEKQFSHFMVLEERPEFKFHKNNIMEGIPNLVDTTWVNTACCHHPPPHLNQARE